MTVLSVLVLSLIGLVVVLRIGTRSDRTPVRVGAKALLAALIVAIVSVLVFFVLAFQRWDEDQRACDLRRESDPGVSFCMEDRRNSRWGPWHTLGHTADITYQQD
jgi:hypothetical protein